MKRTVCLLLVFSAVLLNSHSIKTAYASDEISAVNQVESDRQYYTVTGSIYKTYND